MVRQQWDSVGMVGRASNVCWQTPFMGAGGLLLSEEQKEEKYQGLRVRGIGRPGNEPEPQTVQHPFLEPRLAHFRPHTDPGSSMGPVQNGDHVW